MAPIKRKGEAVVEIARPEKKQKPSSIAKTSILRAEEPAFPRGGASILTPLEHKQIQIQAKQDVLFEQSTGRKAAKNDYEDEDDEDIPEQPSGQIAKTKRGQKHKGKKGVSSGTVEEASVRIEGLSYKVDDL
jgi:rRNA biogenesis protein RRP5